MGVAVPQALMGGWSPGPPQKFGHLSKFVGQLLSREQVLHDTHVGVVGNNIIINVNLPKTPNMILRHAHCTSSTNANGSLLVF